MRNFMKIRPVEVELLHADGEMDGHRHVGDKAALRIFANAPQHLLLNGFKGSLHKNQ